MNIPKEGHAMDSYLAYKPITLSYLISIYLYSCVMFVMKFMSICYDKINYEEIKI